MKSDIIKTLKQARKKTYGGHGGSIGRTPYKEGRCVQEIVDYRGSRFGFWSQCSRRAHFGPGNLYCRIHDPAAVEDRAKKREEKFDHQCKMSLVRAYGHAMLDLLRETKDMAVIGRRDGQSAKWLERRDEILSQLS